jgi:hypothetical protein
MTDPQTYKVPQPTMQESTSKGASSNGNDAALGGAIVLGVVGLILGFFTGGIGIAAMGTAIGVSGPVAGAAVGGLGGAALGGIASD